MNYALIKENKVANIIWLSPSNAKDFPNTVALNDIPAGIGDEYIDGIFYRDGKKLLSPLEAAYEQIAVMEASLAEADAALLDLTYQNILEGVEA